MRNFQLSRRTFLRSSSAMIGLPFLEAMIPSIAHAATPTRLVVVYSPNGEAVEDWVGTSPAHLSGLNAVRSDLTILRGFDNTGGRGWGDGHAPGISRFLTCQNINESTTEINSARSFDQIIGDRLGKEPLYISGPFNMGAANGFAAEYFNNVSWKGPRAATKLNRASQVFNKIYSTTGTGTPTTTVDSVKTAQKSILDFSMGEASRLNQNLGRSDKAKLDEYLTSIRETEAKIGVVEQEMQACRADTGAPADQRIFEEHTKLLYDLSFKALQCNPSQIITYVLDAEVSDASFGGESSHHEHSHSGDAAYRKMNKWYVDQFGVFLGKLKGAQEAGGTILDKSIVLYGNGLGNGGYHEFKNLCTILAGRGGGTLNPTGANIDVRGAKLANLYVKLFNAMGDTRTKFGDSTGALTGI